MQAAAIIHEIRGTEDLITEDDRGELVERAKAIGFSTQFFMPILDAFANLKVKGKRRRGQHHHHHHHRHHHHQPVYHHRRFFGVRGCLNCRLVIHETHQSDRR